MSFCHLPWCNFIWLDAISWLGWNRAPEIPTPYAPSLAAHQNSGVIDGELASPDLARHRRHAWMMGVWARHVKLQAGVQGRQSSNTKLGLQFGWCLAGAAAHPAASMLRLAMLCFFLLHQSCIQSSSVPFCGHDLNVPPTLVHPRKAHYASCTTPCLSAIVATVIAMLNVLEAMGKHHHSPATVLLLWLLPFVDRCSS